MTIGLFLSSEDDGTVDSEIEDWLLHRVELISNVVDLQIPLSRFVQASR